ncbi:PIG-L family deacetylase [Pontibacter aydingkolensis]|uniref:PIG-L family deacetylase n=2 Tax=Pontibacter aydingkolensis TaxID=1911536 RepID=A0ABS7CT01_9BACT|nr:PIG-L family deacetylase [Pontibacter aydingkolensis]MBW7466976.1 PIG-L family deacetylase [Pontibacter aydingkolensis]
MLFLFSCGPSKSDLEALSPSETYPEDTFLATQENKKALIVVAHDDDLVAMSGTISKLNQQGWEVKQVTFISESPERDEALKNAVPLIMDGVEFINIAPEDRRSDLKPDDLPYMPIPKADFEKAFTNPAVADALLKEIKAFEPTVIFSMDNVMGGYGHPEHIFVSQLLLDWFSGDIITPKRIYQTVYPDSMEDKIIKQRLTKLFEEWGQPNSYMTALEMYNITGMPEPTVEINIEDQSESKMKFLRAFNERERQVISFFVPYFEKFDHEEYFGVFNREFFRVIEKK